MVLWIPQWYGRTGIIIADKFIRDSSCSSQKNPSKNQPHDAKDLQESDRYIQMVMFLTFVWNSFFFFTTHTKSIVKIILLPLSKVARSQKNVSTWRRWGQQVSRLISTISDGCYFQQTAISVWQAHRRQSYRNIEKIFDVKKKLIYWEINDSKFSCKLPPSWFGI